jgi:hypothetical protein
VQFDTDEWRAGMDVHHRPIDSTDTSVYVLPRVRLGTKVLVEGRSAFREAAFVSFCGGLRTLFFGLDTIMPWSTLTISANSACMRVSLSIRLAALAFVISNGTYVCI